MKKSWIIILFASISTCMLAQPNSLSSPEEDPCSFVVPHNAFENGLMSTTEGDRVVANDLIVPVNENFALNQIKVDFFLDDEEFIDHADISYLEDNNGVPGAVIGTLTDVVPDVAYISGTVFGFHIWFFTFDIPTFTFVGQPDEETRYWISVTVTDTSGSDFVYWETTTATLKGLPSAIKDSGSDWEIYDSGDGFIYDGVAEFNGECFLSSPDQELSDISLYPNPASDKIYLEVSNSEESYQADLYNAIGERIEVPLIDNTLDVSQLSTGLYFVKVYNSYTSSTFKVIKE